MSNGTSFSIYTFFSSILIQFKLGFCSGSVSKSHSKCKKIINMRDTRTPLTQSFRLHRIPFEPNNVWQFTAAFIGEWIAAFVTTRIQTLCENTETDENPSRRLVTQNIRLNVTPNSIQLILNIALWLLRPPAISRQLAPRYGDTRRDRLRLRVIRGVVECAQCGVVNFGL